MLCLFACKGQGAEQTAAPAEQTLLPENYEVVTLAITPEPYVTPEPKIKDAWYAERSEQLARQIREFGGVQYERDVQKRVAGMSIDPDQKKVAFTFDDGPRDELTDAVLDICEEYNVRVTFFIKGAYIQGHEAQLKRMLALGCEIGNHTWDHTDVAKLTSDEMRQQIGSVNSTVFDLLGYRIRLFRPPYISYGKKGDATRETLIGLMNEYDMAVINHTRSSHDTYDNYTEDMIYERCVMDYDEESGHKLHNSIILCHDKTDKTVKAFRRAVPTLLEKGYQFLTVSELLYCSKEGFHSGWIYSKPD